MILAIAVFAFFAAAIPAVLFVVNLRAYGVPPRPTGALPAVSVLIPARNEAGAIGDAVRAVLASTGVDFEVVVMDDSSTDGTAEIVRALATADPRVRLEQAPALERGWNGKQHACWALAQTARNPILCFVDADVRLEPECVSRMAALLERGDNGAVNGLVSGFPRQITGSFLEWLLLPLIHFVLLGFLPLFKMRSTTDPAFAAGCGQFLMVRASSYFACGGHTGIKLTMHDGLRLPRLFREHGFRTDLADITPYASCRMYTSAAQVWSGLAKNATEGIAAPGRIVPISIVLLLGQVLPFLYMGLLLAFAAKHVSDMMSAGSHMQYTINMTLAGALALLAMALALVAAWLPRWMAAARFRQDWRSALLHPFGIAVLLVLQWYALIRKLRGGQVTWRNRAYVNE